MPQDSPEGLGLRKHVGVEFRDVWLLLVVIDRMSAACSLCRSVPLCRSGAAKGHAWCHLLRLCCGRVN